MDASEVFARLEFPPGRRAVSVSDAEGAYLYDLVRRTGASRTVECGLGLGASAACILAASSGRHVVADPNQRASDSPGLANLTRLGLDDRVEFHQTASHVMLAQLASQGRTIDFAFVDGRHLYDYILVDFFLIDQILERGGHIVLHDAWLRSTSLVAAFIARNRRDYRRVHSGHRNLVVFQKVGEDTRAWHHIREFCTWRGLLSQRLGMLLVRWRGYR